MTITRRAALAGATAIVTTAALPAMAASAAGSDAELFAMIDRMLATKAEIPLAEEAYKEAVVAAAGEPKYEIIPREWMVGIGRGKMFNAEGRDTGPGFAEAAPWLDRCDRLEADLKVQDARIAETPAKTLAGVLAKVRHYESGPGSRAVLQSALADLERMAG
jgi:hypothetical protein